MDKERALESVRKAQAQLDAVDVRMAMFKEMFRDERDQAIVRALEAGVSTRDIAVILGVTPQWVNKQLRDASKRSQQ